MGGEPPETRRKPVAQASLYRQLGCQLKTLWSNNGQKVQDGAEKHVEAALEPEPPQTPEPLLPGTPGTVQAVQP